MAFRLVALAWGIALALLTVAGPAAADPSGEAHGGYPSCLPEVFPDVEPRLHCFCPWPWPADELFCPFL